MRPVAVEDGQVVGTDRELSPFEAGRCGSPIEEHVRPHRRSGTEESGAALDQGPTEDVTVMQCAGSRVPHQRSVMASAIERPVPDAADVRPATGSDSDQSQAGHRAARAKVSRWPSAVRAAPKLRHQAMLVIVQTKNDKVRVAHP